MGKPVPKMLMNIAFVRSVYLTSNPQLMLMYNASSRELHPHGRAARSIR